MDNTTVLLISKGGAILGSALLHLIFGLVPLKVIISLQNAYYSYENVSAAVDHRKRWSRIVCALTCFAGGIFLGTCLISMLPELQIHYRCVRHLIISRHLNEKFMNYPWPEFAACMGFFIVFFIEEVTLCILKQRKTKGETRRRAISEKSDNDETAAVMLRQFSGNGQKQSRRSRTMSQCGDLLEPPLHPHPHSHIVRSIVILSTLSFHTVIESMSYVSYKNARSVWSQFWTTNIHQVVVAFALGTQLARTHRRNVAFIIASICFFSLSTPIGFLSGLAFEAAGQHLMTEEMIVMILEGLAVGAFLYVTFYEVLSHELNNEHSSILKLACISLGCLCICALSFVVYGSKRCGMDVH